MLRTEIRGWDQPSIPEKEIMDLTNETRKRKPQQERERWRSQNQEPNSDNVVHQQEHEYSISSKLDIQ